jgi:hypothetical protein
MAQPVQLIGKTGLRRQRSPRGIPADARFVRGRNRGMAAKSLVPVTHISCERMARNVYRTRDEAKADVFDYIERHF